MSLSSLPSPVARRREWDDQSEGRENERSGHEGQRACVRLVPLTDTDCESETLSGSRDGDERRATGARRSPRETRAEHEAARGAGDRDESREERLAAEGEEEEKEEEREESERSTEKSRDDCRGMPTTSLSPHLLPFLSQFTAAVEQQLRRRWTQSMETQARVMLRRRRRR